jgi:2-phospho-L-lactate guanylyltransferase
MWAIVPLKSPERAKTRLAGALSPAQRHGLLFELGQRVIVALQASRGIERVAVVTASSEVAAFARTLGAQTIMQKEETGTAAAFTAALHELQPLILKSILMIAGDLPLVTSAAVERLIAARDSARSSPPVAGGEIEWGHPRRQDAPSPTRRREEGARASATAIIVPDRHDIGTNALLCSPPEIIPPCFGRDSFRRHLFAAEQAGIRARVLDIDELALDLDCPADLDVLRLRGYSVAEPAPTRRVAGVSR